MVAAQEGVGPGTGAAERVVPDDRRALEHGHGLTIGAEPVVGLRPDAGFAGHLALALDRAAAGPVALVLGAGTLGALIGDVRQGAVAAVLAVEQRHLHGLLEYVRRPAQVRRLERAVHARTHFEPTRPGLEGHVMHESVEAVEERDTLGAGRRARPVGRELRHVADLVQAVGGGLGEVDVRQECLPLGGQRIGQDQDPVDLGGIPLARDVDAGIAQAPGDRHLLGRELEEGSPALVRCCRLSLDPRPQAVAEPDARDAVGIEDAGHAPRQDVDRGHQRDRSRLGHVPPQQLGPATRVIPDLGDGQVRSGAHLHRELEVLRHQVRLERLEGVDGTAHREAQALGVGVSEHGDEPDRIDVEDRPRAAAEAFLGVVAAEGQDIGQALAGQSVGRGLEGCPAAVATGQMDHALRAHLLDGVAEGKRPKAHEAAGVIGHGEGGDPLVGGQLTGRLTMALTGRILQGTGPRHQLHERGAAVVAGERIGEPAHQRYSSTA